MFRVHAFSSNIRDSFTRSHPPKRKVAVEIAVKIASVKALTIQPVYKICARKKCTCSVKCKL